MTNENELQNQIWMGNREFWNVNGYNKNNKGVCFNNKGVCLLTKYTDDLDMFKIDLCIYICSFNLAFFKQMLLLNSLFDWC